VRAVELAGTCAAALVVLAGPLAVMVLLLPRLIEPDTEVPPTMSVRVTAVPLMIGAGAAVVITVLAVVVAARRSAALKPGEVLRDDA
jgi:ABC-type lipoprotein release transport system permease subunit